MSQRQRREELAEIATARLSTAATAIRAALDTGQVIGAAELHDALHEIETALDKMRKKHGEG